MPRPKKKSSPPVIKRAKVADEATVRNLSLQGLEICFNSIGDLETVWLGPRQERKIRRDFISSQILNLQEQRMIRIT